MKTGMRIRVAVVSAITLAICAVVGPVCLPWILTIFGREPFGLPLTSVERRHDWQAFGGTWQFLDGAIRNSSNDRGAKLMNGSEYWTNYVVDADVLLLGEYGFAGLTIRASDEEDAIGTTGQHLFEAVGKVIPCDRLGVDIESAIGANADDNFARGRRRLRSVGGRLRNTGIEPGGFLGHDDHKDN